MILSFCIQSYGQIQSGNDVLFSKQENDFLVRNSGPAELNYAPVWSTLTPGKFIKNDYLIFDSIAWPISIKKDDKEICLNFEKAERVEHFFGEYQKAKVIDVSPLLQVVVQEGSKDSVDIAFFYDDELLTSKSVFTLNPHLQIEEFEQILSRPWGFPLNRDPDGENFFGYQLLQINDNYLLLSFNLPVIISIEYQQQQIETGEYGYSILHIGDANFETILIVELK